MAKMAYCQLCQITHFDPTFGLFLLSGPIRAQKTQKTKLKSVTLQSGFLHFEQWNTESG